MQLVLRHVSYDRLIDYLNTLNDYVDVVSTTNIPTPLSANNVIYLNSDIFFNVDKTDNSWFNSLGKYESVVIFQSNANVPIPNNIIKFVKRLMEFIPLVRIVYSNNTFNEFNYELFAEYTKKLTNDLIYPNKLSISISDKCNLRCNFCYRNDESTYKVITINEFKRIPIQLLRMVTDVELSGYGEILMNPDFKEILDYVSQFNNVKRIFFTTNATLLKPSLVDYIIQNPKVSRIEISLDTLRPELYKEIRKPASFDKVISNIIYLSSVKPTSLHVYLKMVLTTETIYDILEMIKFTKNCNFERLVTLPMHISKESNIPLSIYFKQSEVNEIYTQATKLAKELNVALTLPPKFKGISSSVFRDYNSHPCSEPFDTMYINSNGDVTPCCFTTHVYGNVYTQSIDDILNGKLYQHLRKYVNTSKCPSYCKICGMTENMDNIEFLVKKGALFSEPDIQTKVKNYMEQYNENN